METATNYISDEEAIQFIITWKSENPVVDDGGFIHRMIQQEDYHNLLHEMRDNDRQQFLYHTKLKLD